MMRWVAGTVDGFAKLVAFLYTGLGIFALVLGLGLFAGFWTLQEIGGGVVEKTMGPGFFMRLILPFLLGTRIAVEYSAVFLVVIGACHLAGGGAYLQRWEIGRYVLVALSGFYVVLQMILVGRALSYDPRTVVPPLVFFALHALFFCTFLSRPVRSP